MILKEDIEKAHLRIEPFVHFTPIITSTLIDKLTGAEIYFKAENFQKIGAFKMRGASNAVLKNLEKAKARGVITHSSGNHAQALAKAALLMGVKAYIVMPKNAPQVKVDAVKAYKAEVIFCDNTLESRRATCKLYEEKLGAYFVAPYDDWDVIEGQATAAKELISECPDLDYILVPVGGGGLCAGSVLTTQYFAPHIKVIGAEPLEANDAARSFIQKEYLTNKTPPQTVADGLKTDLGLKNWSIIKDGVKDIIEVEEKEIIDALKLFISRTKVFIEPSSATPLAALIKHKEKFLGKKVGIILSGGNMDLNHLPF